MRLIAPVFLEEDAAMMAEIMRKSRGIMTDWLRENYRPLEQDLGQLTTLRNGISYQRYFSQIWHYVFGYTNRELIDAGLMADPYEEGRQYKGFLPMAQINEALDLGVRR